MTAPAEKTAVATTPAPQRRLLDVDSARANRRFLDAYTTGRLNDLAADEQAMFLFALGAKIGLKPELGELMIFQGKPYITIDGRLRLAHNTGLLVGMEPRPATVMERRNYGVEAGDALWVCDVYRRGAVRPFRGWGHVKENDKGPVTKTHQREMAKKRARYDALRTAFPPAETIGPMHEKYIAEAEALAASRAPSAPAQLIRGEYTEAVEETTPDALDERDEVKPPPRREVPPFSGRQVVDAHEELGNNDLPPDESAMDDTIEEPEPPTQGAIPLPTAVRPRKDAVREGR